MPANAIYFSHHKDIFRTRHKHHISAHIKYINKRKNELKKILGLKKEASSTKKEHDSCQRVCIEKSNTRTFYLMNSTWNVTKITPNYFFYMCGTNKSQENNRILVKEWSNLYDALEMLNKLRNRRRLVRVLFKFGNSRKTMPNRQPREKYSTN